MLLGEVGQKEGRCVIWTSVDRRASSVERRGRGREHARVRQHSGKLRLWPACDQRSGSGVARGHCIVGEGAAVVVKSRLKVVKIVR